MEPERIESLIPRRFKRMLDRAYCLCICPFYTIHKRCEHRVWIHSRQKFCCKLPRYRKRIASCPVAPNIIYSIPITRPVKRARKERLKIQARRARKLRKSMMDQNSLFDYSENKEDG